MSRPCSVIIIEDNPYMGRFYCLYFAKVNIDPIVFTDPLIALDHFKQDHRRYSVALLSSRLCPIDILELARTIRRYNSEIKILLLNAHHIQDPLRNTRLAEAGVSEVLSKPISIDKIGSRIITLCAEKV